MNERKRNRTPDADLTAAAEEELNQAAALEWKQLAKVVPWGDRYDGFAPGGGAVFFERSYVWADGEGGDILCEVRVFRGESQYDDGAKLGLVIAKPGSGA